MSRSKTLALALILAAALAACGSSSGGLRNPGGSPDAGGSAEETDSQAPDDDSGPSGAEPGAISIYLAGDHTERRFTDGLSSQTARRFTIALSKYYLMTAADDPAPVLCFDHRGTPVVADMAGDTLVGACDTASVPAATYTHGRVKVDWTRYTVSAVVHGDAAPVAGDITYLRAYSRTRHEGTEYEAGTGTVTLPGALSEPLPITFGPLPEIPGVELELVDSELWMTFPYSTPLPIDPEDPGAHWARFHWEVYQGFRWREREAPGYSAEAWDVALLPEDSEEVVFAGVTGYSVTSSVD